MRLRAGRASHRLATWPLLTAALLVWVVPATASADEELLGLEIRNRAQIGGPPPALIIRPQISVKRLKVTLTPKAGGRAVRLRAQGLRGGQQKVLGFKQGLGRRAWRAAFDVVWGTGEKEQFQLEFETTVYPKIAFKRQDLKIDFDHDTLEVRMNQPAGRVDLTVWGDNGKVIHEEQTEFEGPEPGTPLAVSWERPPGVGVLKLQLKLWSTFGFWVGAEITAPIEIPHEEVEFDFGKWDVRVSEGPKMEAALKVVVSKLKRYGGIARFQLYIAGFTDTVGSRGSNQALSEKRARSIGAWFRRRGIRVPIFYRGFGEDVLAKKTPDETKEAKNRRAEYVLSDGPPPIQGNVSNAGWRKL